MRYFALMVLMIAAVAEGKISASKPAPTTQPEVLAEVRTTEDLKKQPLFDIPGVGKVRLGIGPYDPEVGPWRVVYCLQEGGPSEGSEGDEIEPPAGEDRELGPLKVYSTYTNKKEARAIQCGGDICKMAWDSPQLHQTLVPLVEEGTAKIRIVTPAGHFVAGTTVKVDKAAESPWQPFAQTPEDDAADALATAAVRAERVVPKVEGTAGLSKDSNNVPLWPLEPELKLTLKGGKFTIDAGKHELLDSPAETLIARWWVNGEAVNWVACGAEAQEQAKKAADSITSEMTVAFGLPDNLSDLKVGDKVTVQVLYSEQGFELAPPMKDLAEQKQLEAVMARSEAWLPVAISDKLEFVVTKKMLKKRK